MQVLNFGTFSNVHFQYSLLLFLALSTLSATKSLLTVTVVYEQFESKTAQLAVVNVN